jgi:hypothetical protein
MMRAERNTHLIVFVLAALLGATARPAGQAGQSTQTPIPLSTSPQTPRVGVQGEPLAAASVLTVGWQTTCLFHPHACWFRSAT